MRCDMENMKNSAECAETKSRFIIGLRWVAVLPAATLAVMAISVAFNSFELLVRWMPPVLVPRPDPFWGRLSFSLLHAMTSAVAFLLAGAKVAPSHRKIVLYVLSSFGLFLTGSFLLLALMMSDYWLIFGFGVFAVSCGVIMYYADEMLDFV